MLAWRDAPRPTAGQPMIQPTMTVTIAQA